jgi:hypothetical protein
MFVFSGVKPKINILDILKTADDLDAQAQDQGECYWLFSFSLTFD